MNISNLTRDIKCPQGNKVVLLHGVLSSGKNGGLCKLNRGDLHKLKVSKGYTFFGNCLTLNLDILDCRPILVEKVAVYHSKYNVQRKRVEVWNNVIGEQALKHRCHWGQVGFVSSV